MKGKIEYISIDKMINYRKNPRHTVANDDIETFKNLFEKVGNQYMLNLAEDIFNNDLLPMDIVTVVFSEELQKYVVYEGNRRIACIKLLLNPDEFVFLDNNTINKIKKITSAGFKYDFNKIQAYITDEEEGFYIMEKVHTGEDQGRGRKKWSSREREDFKSRRNETKTMGLVIDEYVRKYKDNFDITMILPFTTLDRVFNNREIRRRIGIDLSDESTFTKERVELIFFICKKIADKAIEENQGVSRVFNKARIIEDIIIPWIEEYFANKDDIDVKNKSEGNENVNGEGGAKGAQPTEEPPTETPPTEAQPPQQDRNKVKVLLTEKISVTEGTEIYLKNSDIIGVNPNEIEIIKNGSVVIDDRYIFKNSNNVGAYVIDYLYMDEIYNLTVTVEKKVDSSGGSDGKSGTGAPANAGGKANLPYFFMGLKFDQLNPNDSDTHGVSRICNELKIFSERRHCANLPISSAFLVRAIIEHSLILYSKKNKVQGQNKLIWENISHNGKAVNLHKIVENYLRNLSNYILDTNIREYFVNIFKDYNANTNPLNWVVHRPEEFVLAPDKLITLPSEGLLTVINYLINQKSVS